MVATEKLSHKRLTLLQLAEKLGNISKACRMHKVSCSQFYDYKRAFQQHGLEGLQPKRRVKPASGLSEGVREKILAIKKDELKKLYNFFLLYHYEYSLIH